MMVLKDWGGCFNEKEHTYTLDGKSLKGITGIIKTHLFPTEYEGIPAFVLRKAASKGTEVHRACEEYDNSPFHTIKTPEVEVYAKMTEDLNHECSEYFVTDEDSVASAIDKVYRVDDVTFDIADIKNTSKPNIPYVTWQLSIYAYLFEKMNPWAKVRNLYLLHIRSGKRIDISRLPDEEVVRLLECDKNGEIYTPPLGIMKYEENVLPAPYNELMASLDEKLRAMKRIEQEKGELVETLLKAMEKCGIKKIDNELFSITYVAPTTKTSLDTKAIKENEPNVYIKYAKITPQKSSIKINLKKKKDEQDN